MTISAGRPGDRQQHIELVESPVLLCLKDLEIPAFNEGHRNRLGDFRAFISVKAVLRMIETLDYQRRSLKDCGYSIHSILWLCPKTVRGQILGARAPSH
jgi:hypothetical protein